METLTVTALNQLLKTTLTSQLPTVLVQGEVSNFVQAQSGHWYFTLKDAKSQIKCVMFARANSATRAKNIAGQTVITQASVSIYEPRGDLQLIINKIQVDGLGALHQEYLARKQRLEKLGLFAIQNKRPIPRYPRHIGVVTSIKGAVLHDILVTLQRRFSGAIINVYPCLVQGSTAADSIRQALNTASIYNQDEVIILARGGGSFEDLFCFNDEALVHQLAACQTPIISAIGHETDITLCDFAADLRAPTPTAAAELVTQYWVASLGQLESLQSQLTTSIQLYLKALGQKVISLHQALTHPREKIDSAAMKLDFLRQALEQNLLQLFTLQQQRYKRARLDLLHAKPNTQIHNMQQALQLQLQLLIHAMQNQLEQLQHRALLAQSRLDEVSPLAVLKRGYAIATNAQNEVINSAKQVQNQELIQLQLGQGQLRCIVHESR